MASESCSEPYHTRGPSPKPCRICSLPVCEGCIVKTSFVKEDVTLHMCRAHFCAGCWISGKPNRECRPPESLDVRNESFCECSTQDKWLCHRCKHARKPFSGSPVIHCEGPDCSTIMEPGCCGGITCLLCGRESQPGRELSQREYDSTHLFARFFSAFDPDTSDLEDCAVETETSQPSRTDLIATPSSEVFQVRSPTETARTQRPQERRAEMHQIRPAFSYGASQLQICNAVEIQASQPWRTDVKEKTSSTESFQEKRPFSEKVERERRKAGRMQLLRTMWKRADSIRSRLRVFHSPKAILRGYSRI